MEKKHLRLIPNDNTKQKDNKIISFPITKREKIKNGYDFFADFFRLCEELKKND